MHLKFEPNKHDKNNNKTDQQKHMAKTFWTTI